MRDAFSHYPRPFLWPYAIFGTLTVISGAILFVVPLLQRKKSNTNQVEVAGDAASPKQDLSSEEQ